MSISLDYKTSYNAICDYQKEMVFTLYDLMSEVSDENLRVKLEALCVQQSKIYRLSKNYFDTLNDGVLEHRAENRESLLGVAKFQEVFIDDIGEGQCFDISEHGACLNIENYEDIFTGERMKLWIHLLEDVDSIKREGIVRWKRKVNEGSCICGIQFC